MRVAALDLGSNTTLAVVVERGRGGEIEVIGDRAIVTGLGRGATPALRPERIAETLAAVAELSAWARGLGAVRLAAVGTSAIRDAPNREEILAPVRALLDGPADAIAGAREAALTFRGARAGLPPDLLPGEFTVVDVGGGSTEIVRGHGQTPAEAASLDVGAVRLTERWLRHDPPLAAEREALAADVDAALGPSARLLVPPLLCVAGTATNLGACALGIGCDRLREVVGRRVPVAALLAAAERVVSTPIAGRRALPGIERGREESIAGGALLLGRLAERAGAVEVVVGDGGVRFGLAMELLDGLAATSPAAAPAPCGRGTR